MAAIPAINAVPGHDVAAIRALLDSWQARISLKKIGRGHHYICDGAKKGCASVTTINNARVSPRLIDWSSRVEREACIETAWKLIGKIHGASLRGEPDFPTDRARFTEDFTTAAGLERENQKILREAGDLGSELHSLIEWSLRGTLENRVIPEPTVSDRALAVFGNFETWAMSVNLEPVALESRVFHTVLNYGGTIDALAYATLPGKPRRLFVCDWKTSKGIWPEMRLQSAAYRVALVQMGLPESGGLLLHLPKEGDRVGTVDAIEVEEPIDELMAAFLAMKTIHGFMGRYR